MTIKRRKVWMIKCMMCVEDCVVNSVGFSALVSDAMMGD